MESYPEDLLVGVFPLVFCVDTTANHNNDDDDDEPKRKLFDRFLDAVAALLMEDENGDDAVTDKRRRVSLFQADDSDESDDDGLLDAPKQQQQQPRGGIYPGFGRRTTTTITKAAGDAASYAKALTHGQGFFQRARIESISAKHGFPPSKDPDGTHSLSHALQQAVRDRKQQQQLDAVFEQHSSTLDGILPAGWLAKQAHALPSVILVVATVSAVRAQQDEQDARLLETVKNLQESLATKRGCSIQVVGLMDDEITQAQADGWGRAVASQMEDQESPPTDPVVHVTVLRASSDVQSNDTGMPTSVALKQLHRTVRDASLAYYLGQARRTKEKLTKLRGIGSRRGRAPTGPPTQLLPLVIRYYFKIALFYEFQWNHQKSLRYMSEGYRHIVQYYKYLVSRTMNRVNSDGKLSSGEDEMDVSEISSGGDSVEVSISNTKSIAWSKVVPDPPDDMIHQCRAVADWLNLKILTAGFVSRTASGLLAAASQWRHHSAVFCSSKIQLSASIPAWLELSYVVRQRLVVSEMVERHPPAAFGELGKDCDEVLLRCSAWRNYESAAEAMLRLSTALQRATTATEPGDSVRKEAVEGDPMRPVYVGGLGSEGLIPVLAEERRVVHKGRFSGPTFLARVNGAYALLPTCQPTEKALELLLRAISLFERELEEDKRGFYAEDHFNEQSSSRTGARLYYLSGGVLLGMGRHEEAVAKLTKAAKFAYGWKELELAVRRMLIECYGKHIPSQSDTSDNSDALASMILDSYFNAEMSSTDLRKALDHFSSISGGGSLKWFHEAVEDELTGLPFSFAVSFPQKTHATAGDTVKASVLVQSNLDYAVHVKTTILLTLAGQIQIPGNDLLSAANASEGSDGGIIIQAKTAIIVSTEIKLPKDTAMIASDDSGNGGEEQGVAGKGSFAKSARPRSAGITAAGGARLVSEEILGPGSQRSQGWSMNFLGGKALRCDGLRLIFYPVQAERASAENVTLIELTIQKKKPRTAANIKRTPFEEENYVASAWSRPQYLPLSRGPRSLRVLGPMPHLVVTNLTDELTKGKAIEGTVNRILLRLQAGPKERCSDMKVSISCFSVLVTPSGTTKRLVAEDEISPESENSVDMKNPSYRTPVLVSPTTETSDSGYGYDLPRGWALSGTGQKQPELPLPTLDCGQSSYVHLDIFRPAASLQADTSPDQCQCETDVYMTVSYRQGRPSAKSRRSSRRSIRRPTRRPPGIASDDRQQSEASTSETPETGTQDDSCDDVSLEYTGSLAWTSPLRASFTPGTRRGQASGSRHPANAVEDDPHRGSDVEFSLVDGETVTTKCSLELDATMEELQTTVADVRFQVRCRLESL